MPDFIAPSPDWSANDLSDAALLDLGAVPVRPGAVALVGQLSDAIIAADTIKRRVSDQAKLRKAVTSVVGGTLRSWSKERAVFRSRSAATFAGELVGHRSYIAAVNSLALAGLLATKGGISFIEDFGADCILQGRKAERLRPTERLLRLAADHGITPANVLEQFGLEFSRTPPKVPVELVERRFIRAGYRRSAGARDRAPLPPDCAPQHRKDLAEEVRQTNEFIKAFDVRGCLPPRWRRTFGPSWLLGGRWVALGASGVYQRLRKKERRHITIDGQPTVEVDVSGSHLSIMHGLLGLPLPKGDLYAFPGLPRDVAKQWVTASLGKGSAVKRWPHDAVKDEPELASRSASEVGAAIVSRFPFMATPGAAVSHAAALTELASLGTPEVLLPHRLMGIEAAAMTEAVSSLRARRIPALSVHDSLIVPETNRATAIEAIQAAFEAHAGVRVRVAGG